MGINQPSETKRFAYEFASKVLNEHEVSSNAAHRMTPCSLNMLEFPLQATSLPKDNETLPLAQRRTDWAATFESLRNADCAPNVYGVTVSRQTPDEPSVFGKGVIVVDAVDEYVAIREAEQAFHDWAKERAPNHNYKSHTQKHASKPSLAYTMNAVQL